MNDLRQSQENECVSLLEEFIQEAAQTAEKKRIAALALIQLQRITAGTGTGTSEYSDPKCNGKPRAG